MGSCITTVEGVRSRVGLGGYVLRCGPGQFPRILRRPWVAKNMKQAHAKPAPHAKAMTLDDLFQAGLSEVHLSKISRNKKERANHHHTARELIVTALRQNGLDDPCLREHLLAVLRKLGDDARGVKSFRSHQCVPTKFEYRPVDSESPSDEMLSGDEVNVDDNGMASEHVSEGVENSVVRLWEYVEMKAQLLPLGQEPGSPNPVSPASSRMWSSAASSSAPASRSQSRSTTRSCADVREFFSTGIIDPIAHLKSSRIDEEAKTEASSEPSALKLKKHWAKQDSALDEGPQYFTFANESSSFPLSGEDDGNVSFAESNLEQIEAPLRACRSRQTASSSQLNAAGFKLHRRNESTGEECARFPEPSVETTASLSNTLMANVLQMRDSIGHQPAQGLLLQSQDKAESGPPHIDRNVIAAFKHFAPSPAKHRVGDAQSQHVSDGPSGRDALAKGSSGLFEPFSRESTAQCWTPASSSVSTLISCPRPQPFKTSPLQAHAPNPISAALRSPFSVPLSPRCFNELALPADSCPREILQVRIINGVSGEEEVQFIVPLGPAVSSEKQFYDSIDCLCQKHSGQTLSTLSWLSRTEPGGKLLRWPCELSMVEKLLGDGASISETKPNVPMELLLCTIPAQPPSELPAAKVRLHSLAPPRVQMGSLTSSAPPTKVRLTTSPLDASLRYSIAFTHQWSHTTHKVKARVLPNGQGVKGIVPPSILVPESGNDGLYDIFLVINDSQRSSNRRTLTVASTDELSSSSTVGSFTFDPIKRVAA